MLCLTGGTNFIALAQDSPPGGGDVVDAGPPPPPPPPGDGNVEDVLSITGLLYVFLAAGAVYGIKKKK